MAPNRLTAVAVLAVMLMAPLACAQRGRRAGPPPSQGGEDRGASGEHRAGKSGGKRKHSGDWLRRFSHLPPAQQEQALTGDPEFQKLPPNAQQRLRDRLRWFNALPQDRQNKILNRMDRFGHMNPEQQERARLLFERSRLLPPERHRTVRRAFNRLQEMPRDQRQKEL